MSNSEALLMCCLFVSAWAIKEEKLKEMTFSSIKYLTWTLSIESATGEQRSVWRVVPTLSAAGFDDDGIGG